MIQVYSVQCIYCLVNIFSSQEKIFPDANNNSPIAESLRASLATETWARPGLGLPVELNKVDVEKPGAPQLSSTPAQHKGENKSNDVFSNEIIGIFKKTAFYLIPLL